MGLLEKASARRTVPKGGLRSLAEEFKNKNGFGTANQSTGSVKDSEKKKKVSIEPDNLAELCEKIDAMSPGMEGIVEFFEDFKRLFSISKGAILTKNKADRFFLPRVQTGLDVTSRNRLRFPSESFDSTEKGTWLRFNDYSFLRPFLSSREYELIEDLRMLAIYDEEEPIGMILLFGEEPDELDHVCLPADQIEGFQNSMGNYLRGNKLLRLSSSPPDPASGVAEIKDFFRKMENQQKELTAIRFSLNRLLIHLSVISADVDLFRARKDSLRIIETLFEGSSKIIPLRDDEYLLLLGTRKRPNPQLLQHQVRLALQNFFSDSEARIDFSLAPSPSRFDSLEDLLSQYPPENQP